MRARVLIVTALLGLGFGCAHDDPRDSEAARARERDASSPAYKAGRVAHEIAKDTGKVAAAAGRKIGESARKAHEGWKEQAKEDREKSRSNR